MRLPFDVADYVDFYSSLEHATNLGRIFRPDQDPLQPNWRWLPVGYHGRAGTVVVSGTDVVRPRGQRGAGDFGPTERLDVELELGFVVGVPGARDRGRRVRRPRLRRRARERLERARHPGVGVPAARAVPRQVVPDLDLGLGDAARAARAATRRGAAAGAAAAAAPRRRSRVGPRPRARARAERRGRSRAGTRARSTGRCRSSSRTRPRTAPPSARATSWRPVRSPDAERGSEGSLLELWEGERFLADGDEVVLRARGGDVELGEVRGRVVAGPTGRGTINA